MDDEKKSQEGFTDPQIVFSKEIKQIKSNNIPYGIYNIKNTNSGKYLNLSGGQKGKGINVQIYDNPQSSHTQWIVDTCAKGYIIRSTASGCYINVSGGSSKNGANVQMWDDPESTHSQWAIAASKEGIFTIQNIHTGKYINVSEGGKKNGSNVQMWDNPGSNHSQWQFYCALPLIKNFNVYEGTYNIQNVNALKKYVNVSGGKDAKSANVQIWDNPQSLDSQFVIKKVDAKSNLYTIRFSKSQYNYLNISGGSKSISANVQLYSNKESNHSQFYFDLIDEPSMRVVIRNENSNLFLNCSGNGTKNGTNVQQYCNPQEISSQWYLAPLDMKMIEVKYDLDKAVKGVAKPDVLVSKTVNAKNSSSEQSGSFKNTQSVQTESYFEYKGGFKISVGVETEVKTGVPFVAEGKVKVSAGFETSHDFTKGNKDTITTSFEWDVEVKAPAGKIVRCNATIKKCTLDVPYIMIFQSKSVGTTFTSNGIWHGVSCYDLDLVYEDL
eukprot:298218_1